MLKFLWPQHLPGAQDLLTDSRMPNVTEIYYQHLQKPVRDCNLAVKNQIALILAVVGYEGPFISSLQSVYIRNSNAKEILVARPWL